MFTEIKELLFPIKCIVCHTPSSTLCANCGKQWKLRKIKRTIPHLSPHSVGCYSSITYTRVARTILLSAKEDSIEAADRLLLDALHQSLHHVLSENRITHLVPIPSRSRASRQRGRDFLLHLTNRLGSECEIPVVPLLQVAKRIRDQSGLDHSHRWNNLSGAFVVKAVPKALQGGERLLLVDDLITTGATLSEGIKTLMDAGFTVAGAVTACSAEPVRLAHGMGIDP